MIDLSLHVSLFVLLSSVSSVRSLILHNSNRCDLIKSRISLQPLQNVIRPSLSFSRAGDDQGDCPNAGPSPSSRWLTYEDLNQLSEDTRIPLQTILDWYIDVTVHVSDQTFTTVNILPSYLRLRSTAPVELYSKALQLGCFLRAAHSTENQHPILSISQFAASSTLRWCQYFVAAQDLNLCPWAKGSLTTEGAIRIKIMLISPRDTKAEVKLEQLIRSSAHELVRVTQEHVSGHLPTQYTHVNSQQQHGPTDAHNALILNSHCMNPPLTIETHHSTNYNHHINTYPPIDSNSAITFVVVAPNNNYASGDMDSWYQDMKSIFYFPNFYDFATDLEDQFLDEDDRIKELHLIQQRKQQGDNPSTDPPEFPTLVEDVTVAPFHPRWEFAAEDLDIGEENPVNYEKRSPFPTISLVRTKAIIKAGEEATERIAQHNEQVLNDLGSTVLMEMYKERVWQDTIPL